MRSPLSPLPSQRGKAARNAQPSPAAPAAENPRPDLGWHESSYELKRGVQVIECEWPDTTSGEHPLE